MYFTSGTTGKPKGVVVSHRAVLAMLDSLGELRPGPGDRVALAGSPAFDAATFELWATVTDSLRAAYATYRHEREARERGLTALRAAAVARFSEPPALVIPPRFSVNMVVEFPEWDDSYLCFRDVLRETGVSMLPGILTFCLSGAVMRVTPAQKWRTLDQAVTLLGARSPQPVGR